MSAEEPQGDEAYDDDEEEATDASSSYKYSCQLIDALCGELVSRGAGGRGGRGRGG